MNGISERQNSVRGITLLKAYSYAYDTSKWYSKMQTAGAIASALAAGICSIWFPTHKAIGGLVSFGVLILDLVWLEPRKSFFQMRGASIQELFDVFVLGLPLNTAKVCSQPSPEMINQYAKGFGEDPEMLKSLHDWYPAEASDVPIEFGRLICQRASMHWDSSLRSNVATGYFAAATILGVGSFCWAVLRGWKAEDLLLSAWLPLLPTFQKLIREGGNHRDSAQLSDDCRSQLEANWKKMAEENLSSTEILEVTRRLQDDLFDRRRSAPPVPNAIHRFYRQGFEDDMRHAAKEYSEQVKKRGIEERSDRQT